MISEAEIKKLLNRVRELEKKERAHRKEKERLERLLSSLDTGLSLINADKTVAWINRKIRTMFPDREPIGKICHRFYESSEVPCDSCPTLRCFETGQVFESERFNPIHNRWFQIVSQPVKDAAGNVIQVLEGVTEITDRKQAEKALRESEEKYKVLFRSVPVGVSVSDDSGNILETNYFSEKLLGISQPMHEGRPIDGSEWEIIRPDGTPMPTEEYASVIALKENRLIENMEMGIRKPNAKVTWINVTAAPIPLENYGVVISYMDITDRRAAEKKIQEYASQLEEKVEERTRELKKAQEELLVKERLALLGHFAGSISHELRNPLAAIDASVYYLNMTLGGHDDKTAVHLGRIRSNVKKSTDIIQSLLNLSRMEKPKTTRKNLTDLISETLRSAKIPDPIEVRFDPPEKPVFVDIDPEQIRMALKNIIQNALQAMDESGALTIAVGGLEAGRVVLSVTDTGPGIAPEHLEKIFDPLFSTKTHGIGFGLSITKMIIENHGGTVVAESAPGKGATFTVIFPITARPGRTS